MTRTSSPILWYGDYVDFGSFIGSVSDNDEDREICFRFGIDQLTFGGGAYFIRAHELIQRRPITYNDVRLNVCIAGPHDPVRITSVQVEVGDNQKYLLTLDPSGNVSALTINDADVLRYFSPAKIIVPQGSMFPDVLTAVEALERPGQRYYRGDDSSLAQAMKAAIQPHIHKGIKQQALEGLVTELIALRSFDKTSLAQVGNYHGSLLAHVARRHGRK
jgi:hypothetical protein